MSGKLTRSMPDGQITTSRAPRTHEPYWTVLPILLQERKVTMRWLEQRADVSLAVLWRGLKPEDKAPRKADAKVAFHPLNAEHLRRISEALQLPAGYFREVREAAVHERIARSPELADALYDEAVTRVSLS